jgi:hypothetical protein
MNLWPVNGAAWKPRAESNLSNSRGSANNRARRPAERFPGIVRKRADEGSACRRLRGIRTDAGHKVTPGSLRPRRP